MAVNDENNRTEGPTPLARALARQADAQIGDLAKARGLGGDTFAELESRATELLERAASADQAAQELIRDHRGVLRSVARLLADPAASEIPPSNDAVYAAVLDVTELHAIFGTLGAHEGLPAGRLLAHLITADADAASRDRLSVAFAAVCKRAGLPVHLPPEPGGVVEITLDRWPIAAATAVPIKNDQIGPASAAAEQRLRESGRPGLIVLEAGALLDWSPINVADDETAIGVMNERLDAFMIDTRDDVADATGAEHAFGLVVHATLPATNAASRRLLFAECLRAVNLCDADDPRINGFQSFITALARAEQRQTS